MRTKREKAKVGDVIHMSIGCNERGWWWATRSDPSKRPDSPLHGPFATQEEAEADFHRVALNGAKIVETGQKWDPGLVPNTTPR
jgi:hypothetical protein